MKNDGEFLRKVIREKNALNRKNSEFKKLLIEARDILDDEFGGKIDLTSRIEKALTPEKK